MRLVLDESHGYIINPKAFETVLKGLKKTGGHCPCVPRSTYNANTLCPCKHYRDGKGCHCNLYVKE